MFGSVQFTKILIYILITAWDMTSNCHYFSLISTTIIEAINYPCIHKVLDIWDVLLAFPWENITPKMKQGPEKSAHRSLFSLFAPNLAWIDNVQLGQHCAHMTYLVQCCPNCIIEISQYKYKHNLRRTRPLKYHSGIEIADNGHTFV